MDRDRQVGTCWKIHGAATRRRGRIDCLIDRRRIEAPAITLGAERPHVIGAGGGVCARGFLRLRFLKGKERREQEERKRKNNFEGFVHSCRWLAPWPRAAKTSALPKSIDSSFVS